MMMAASYGLRRHMAEPASPLISSNPSGVDMDVDIEMEIDVVETAGIWIVINN